MPHDIHEEVKLNALAFRAKLPELLATHRGRHALLRGQTIIEFFDTMGDAYVAARLLFATDHLFSIQEIIEPPPRLKIWTPAPTEQMLPYLEESRTGT